MAEALTVHERLGLGIARVMVRAGQGAALRARVQDAFGLVLADAPRIATGNAVALLGVGPGAWLAVRDDAPPDFARTLARDLQGAASVADQSGAYRVFRLSGAVAADVLAAGAFIDFHADVFWPGGVAVTQIALLDATIVRLDGAAFDVAVFRSFAPDFLRFVAEAAAARSAPLVRA